MQKLQASLRSQATPLRFPLAEILAFFVGALAGGFISVAVVKHEFGSEKFENTIYNAMGLIVIAILILVLAAMLEVTISPMISAR